MPKVVCSMYEITLSGTIESLLLVIILSLDAFVASFAYGTDKIKIPFSSVIVINLICSGILAIALFLGSIIKPFMPEHLTTVICFILLMGLGVVRFSATSIKGFLRKCDNHTKNLEFKFFDIHFLLRVYADSTEADKDHSRVLSPIEAASLAFALSLDGLALGFGTGLTEVSYIQVIIFSLISTMIAVLLGCFIGNKVAEKLNLDLSWLSGLLLIFLALMKLR